nr:P-II family nitrogen regulator [Anaerovibrio lipolyticus]
MMKMTKIEIITRSNKLDDLMGALNDIGVLGMTVSQVFGCGLQKGHEEVYRGKKYDINLVPKIKLETVVCEVPVDKVLEAAQKVLRTGNYGDGKIFVYELTDAVRIRTGQRGATAIMDIPGEKKEGKK